MATINIKRKDAELLAVEYLTQEAIGEAEFYVEELSDVELENELGQGSMDKYEIKQK